MTAAIVRGMHSSRRPIAPSLAPSDLAEPVFALSRRRGGVEVLRDARSNHGTAFTDSERRTLGIEGLLPPVPDTLEGQIARVKLQISLLTEDHDKYAFLSDLQARNETLFFAVLISDPALFIPLVYTPTVGEACQTFDHNFRATRGVYLPISARGRLRELLRNWPEHEVRFIVVTDGERILGLGDLGVGGMGIPVGKLALVTACAGVAPGLTLPITLDVGTNNEVLLNDPLYLGLRQPRVRGDGYDSFIDEFVSSVQDLYPHCCIQWEDFANFNAVKILAKYRNEVCTYNDDIQGTAAVALAGVLTALRITGQSLVDQRILFLGAGAAATGMAELLAQAMAKQGLAIDDARQRQWMFDVDGLLVEGRAVADFQRPFTHAHAAVTSFVAAIEAVKPTAIIGVSTVAKLFDQDVVAAMARLNERPIIFPYSNPTSHSECTAEEAYGWSDGRAIFASGSLFQPVQLHSHRFVPGQGNNIYIFPAVAMALLVTGARRVTEELFLVAAQALADQVTAADLAQGTLYPPLANIVAITRQTASCIAAYIFDAGLASLPRPTDISGHIQSLSYQATYAK